jgi:hypothetical protein
VARERRPIKHSTIIMSMYIHSSMHVDNVIKCFSPCNVFGHFVIHQGVWNLDLEDGARAQQTSDLVTVWNSDLEDGARPQQTSGLVTVWNSDLEDVAAPTLSLVCQPQILICRPPIGRCEHHVSGVAVNQADSGLRRSQCWHYHKSSLLYTFSSTHI